MRHIQQNPSLRFLFSFFLLLFSLLTLFSSGRLDSEDGWLYANVAQNIYYNRQIASDPYAYPEKNVHMNTVQGKDGVWRAPGGVGYSFSLVPAVFLSDLVHRAYEATPSQYFPLEHDWSLHLFASMTNAFWGAVLGLILVLYAIQLDYTKKEAVAISLITLGTTNLLPLSKVSFPHMMFITFLALCFYCIKVASIHTHRYKWIWYGGAIVSFLILRVTYNVTYYLPLPALCIYAFLLEKPLIRKKIAAVLGVGAIVLVLGSPTHVAAMLGSLKIGVKVLFEGVWGLLFSSGKSIFLYSPPLLLIPIFWHRIKKSAFAEVVSFGLLFLTYLYFIGSASIRDHDVAVPIWHGGMMWGPRYITPLIPFGMLIVFHILKSASSRQKRFIATPLFLVGFGIQIVGTSVEYLQQYRDIPYNIFIKGVELTVYDYASFIPRYSPFIRLPKVFAANAVAFPRTIYRGPYQVRFFDGFDIPLHQATGTIRGFRHDGYIQITNPTDAPLSVRLLLYNAPDNPQESSAASSLGITADETPVASIALPSQTEQAVTFNVRTPKNRPVTLALRATYTPPLTTPHVIYIKEFKINDSPINMASLDYPEVSTLGSAKPHMPYRYFGSKTNDRWKLWHHRALINALTLDYWWVKNLYYWDRPQHLLFTGFMATIVVAVSSGYAVWKQLKRP